MVHAPRRRLPPRPVTISQRSPFSTRATPAHRRLYERVLGSAWPRSDNLPHLPRDAPLRGFCERADAPAPPQGVVLTLVTDEVTAGARGSGTQGRVRQGAGGESAVSDLQRVVRDPNGYVLGSSGSGSPWCDRGRRRTDGGSCNPYLTKRFGGLVAVDGLPLALRPARCGAHRPTLGQDDDGQLLSASITRRGRDPLRGERIDRLRPHQIAPGRRGRSRLPSSSGMTTLENVLLPPGPQDRATAVRCPSARPRAPAARARDAGRPASAPPRSVGGQSMLLQIARGLMCGRFICS